MSVPFKSARNVCFTINNYKTSEINKLEKLNCEYIVYGFEVGDEGTAHIQGYVEFKSSKLFSVCQNQIGKRAHMEARKSTAAKAADYCKKDKDFVERGTISKQGKRNDIETIREMVNEGKGMREIVDEVSNFQGIRIAEKLLQYKEKKRNWKPTVVWYWGPTGSGKSRRAHEEFPDAWVSGRSLEWWEGYDGHEDIIIDDFRGDFCKFHELLRILDRYEYRVMVKGGSRQLLAKNIVITSPYAPEGVYKTREDVAQLLRRIDWVIELEAAEVGGNTSEKDFHTPTIGAARSLLEEYDEESG